MARRTWTFPGLRQDLLSLAMTFWVAATFYPILFPGMVNGFIVKFMSAYGRWLAIS